MAARAFYITLVLYWAKLCKNSDFNKTVTTLQQLKIILPVLVLLSNLGEDKLFIAKRFKLRFAPIYFQYIWSLRVLKNSRAESILDAERFSHLGQCKRSLSFCDLFYFSKVNSLDNQGA